jgi:dUTP pyrophosphatase
MIVKLKTASASVKIPVYAHGPHEDAGMDLHADEDVFLRPNEPQVVKTGLSIELPPGCEAQIRSRSGLALKNGITVLNSPGTIDPSYRGEIGVILCWNGYRQVGDQPFVIEKGTRIAQMVVAKYEPIRFEQVKELSGTDRGAAGFGSTGTK